jgi:NADH dehydrogenase
LGVEVGLNSAVTDCTTDGVRVGDRLVESRTIIWAAGVAASPAAEWLNADHDQLGRVFVGPDLTLPGHPDIFVIGDTAHARGEGSNPLPGVAPVAKQEGAYAAKIIRARLAGRVLPAPFHYINYGNLATIGRTAAVADFGFVRLTGFIAWIVWCVVHIYFLIGFRNRVAVALDWLWAYVTFQRGARLITDVEMDD